MIRRNASWAVAWAILFLLLPSTGALAVDTTWTLNGDGLWTDPTNWSNGEPNGDGFNALVYDLGNGVAIDLNEARTIGTLTLGDAVSLNVQPLSSTPIEFAADSGITNDGGLFLHGGSAGVTLTAGGAGLDNRDTVQFQALTNTYRGNLANSGSVLVSGSTTFDQASAVYTNNGQFTIAASQSLSLPSGGTFEQTAGTLDVLGSYIQNMGTFKYLGGTINGTPEINRGNLVIGAAATTPVSFLLHNGSGTLTLAGNVLSTGQMLNLQNFTATSATGFTNNGTIELGSILGATLQVTSGTLLNSADGLIHFQPLTAGGLRSFSGSLTNNGTVTVDGATSFGHSGAAYLNNQQFTIAKGTTLSVGFGNFEQAAGTLDVLGGFSQNNGTFTYSGGTINGTVSIRAAGGLTIGDGGIGPANFIVGSPSTTNSAASLSLSVGASGISAQQTVTLTSDAALTTITSPSGFTNHGSLLVSGTNSGETRVVASGTLVNDAGAQLVFQNIGLPGPRNFSGDLTNQGGTVQFNANTTFLKSNCIFQQTSGLTTFRNFTAFPTAGQLNFSGGTVAIQGTLTGGTVTQTGGTLNYSSGAISNGTYRYLGGTISDATTFATEAVTVGTGITAPYSFMFANGGSTLTLDDNVLRAGQSVNVQSASSSGSLTVANGFTNNGSIFLTRTVNGNSTFRVTTGTLTNAIGAQVNIQSSSSSFFGNVANHGTFLINGTTTLSPSSGGFTNDGQFTINRATLFVSSGTFSQTGGSSTINATFSGVQTAQFSGGHLMGTGTLNMPVDNVGASVEPGNSVGKLTMKTYTQHSGGSLIAEIGGAANNQFDVLVITGAAALAGTLDVRLVDLGTGTFAPTAGNFFPILTATEGVTNQFEHVILPSLAPGLSWNVVYAPTSVSLTVTTVPEPSTFGLFLMAVIASSRAGRRRVTCAVRSRFNPETNQSN